MSNLLLVHQSRCMQIYRSIAKDACSLLYCRVVGLSGCRVDRPEPDKRCNRLFVFRYGFFTGVAIHCCLVLLMPADHLWQQCSSLINWFLEEPLIASGASRWWRKIVRFKARIARNGRLLRGFAIQKRNTEVGDLSSQDVAS